MPSVTLTGISLAYADRQILDGVNLTITAGDRVALAGANGSGKSTLMKIMTGAVSPDGGSVTIERDTTAAYLPQSGVVLGDRSLRDEAASSFRQYETLESEISAAEAELAHADHESQDGRELLRRYARLQHQRSATGFREVHAREESLERVLTGLGFVRSEFDRPCSQFSSGWQMRIALARTLLEDPDILLLDEPTNYLDIEIREWLQEYLNGYGGGLFIIAHDRYFLDHTVDRVAEIFLGRLTTYKGNYSQYEKRREEELGDLVVRFQRQQDEIARTEAFIRKYRYNASKARLVQSRVNALERLERIELPPSLKPVHIRIPDPPHSGRDVLRVEGLTRSYDGPPVLRDIDLTVGRGEKLAVVGPNGAGKSTLLRLLAGRDRPDQGHVRYGAGVALGFFSQDELESEDEGSVVDAVENTAPSELQSRVRDLLGAFLFRGDDIYKSVRVLSGGEASRLQLLKMLLRPVNFLVLDEPTNHLDLATKDILLEALQGYKGTVVFVSHDHGFIQGLATRVIEVGGGSITDYPGDYDYYLYRLNGGETRTTDISDEVRTVIQAATASSSSRSRGSGRADRDEAKNRERTRRRLQREERELMDRLSELEAEKTALEFEMAKQEVYTDGKRMRDVRERERVNQETQTELHGRWEEIERKLHELGGKE